MANFDEAGKHDYYYNSYSSHHIHEEMLKDTSRTLAYQRAIEGNPEDFKDKVVLDIGCGNGYFGWRMLGAGADAVVGIDPTLVFCMQHRAVQRLLDYPNHWVLPLGVEDIPASHRFDWVLSMGVLYHRKNPQEHIKQMYALTEDGGKCVMETLVVDAADSLYPQDRYARMRNIGVIPNLTDLRQWMTDAGYQNIELIDLSPTTTEEDPSLRIALPEPAATPDCAEQGRQDRGARAGGPMASPEARKT